MMRHDPDDHGRCTEAEVIAFLQQKGREKAALEAALATAEAMTPDELTDAFHATQEAP